jgi:hypothetical protein
MQINWAQQNYLANLLQEPFDIEGEFYSLIVKHLTSDTGVLLPYKDKLPIVDMDNLLEAKVRNNLLKVPVSTKEEPFKKLVRVNGRFFLNLKVEQKSMERELCEILNNLEMTPHEHMECILQTFHNQLQDTMVTMISKNPNLAAERLKLWGIEITRKFDLFCLNYDQLPVINFGVYNLYNLEQGLANFSQPIPNSQLFIGNNEYLNKLLSFKQHLQMTQEWLG